MVDDRAERLARMADPVLTDAIEHDDRVVDAEADDRQQRGHEQRVELEEEEVAEDREGADDEDHVVEQRDDRRRPETEAEADPQVGEDEQLADDDQDRRAADELVADDRADGAQRRGSPSPNRSLELRSRSENSVPSAIGAGVGSGSSLAVPVGDADGLATAMALATGCRAADGLACALADGALADGDAWAGADAGAGRLGRLGELAGSRSIGSVRMRGIRSELGDDDVVVAELLRAGVISAADGSLA